MKGCQAMAREEDEFAALFGDRNRSSSKSSKSKPSKKQQHTDGPFEEFEQTSVGSPAQASEKQRQEAIRRHKQKNWRIGWIICVAVSSFIVFAVAIGALSLTNSVRRALQSRQFTLIFDDARITAGDTNGSGQGRLSVDKGRDCIEWTMMFANLDTITGAEIRGPLTAESPLSVDTVFFDLGLEHDDNKLNTLKDKDNIEDEGIDDLLDDPQNYYVLIKTSAFPNGAVRAPLGAPGI